MIVRISLYIHKILYALKNGFAHIVLGNTLIKCISFVSSVCVIRLVSKNDFGNLAYVDNLYAYILLVAGFGMPTALLKFCSPNNTREENKYYIKFALTYGICIQILLTVLMISCVEAIGIKFESAKDLLYSSFLYPCIYYILIVFQNVARAYGDNKQYVKIALTQSVAVFMGSILGVIIFGIIGVVYARYIGISLAIIIGYKFAYNRLHSVDIKLADKNKTKQFVFMSIGMMCATLFSSMIPSNEIFLINNIIGSEAVTATYKVAALIPVQLIIVASSVVVYVFPLVANAQKAKDAFKKILYAEFACLFLTLFCMIAGIILNPYLIEIIYGQAYLNSIELSNKLWIVNAMNAGFRLIPLNMLVALGCSSFCAIISGFTCIFHWFINSFMISKFGIEGAVYASGIVYCVSALVLWLYLISYLKTKERYSEN